MSSYHGYTHRRRHEGGTDPIPLVAVLFIKLYPDTGVQPPTLMFQQFAISRDMDLLSLVEAEAYVTTANGSDIEIQLERKDTDGTGGGVSLLSSLLTIDAGDLNSRQSSSPVAIEADSQVLWGDHVLIDVSTPGIGLGLMLTFAKKGG